VVTRVERSDLAELDLSVGIGFERSAGSTHVLSDAVSEIAAVLSKRAVLDEARDSEAPGMAPGASLTR
jgi:hypothetical protein